MKEQTLNTKRIDALDGLRAIAVLLVAWFHIWQQSWLVPKVTVPVFAPIGTESLRIAIFPATGYLFVDFLLVLSAFCLFLPYARHTFGDKAPDRPAVFYQKRMARIVPSYYIAVAVTFVYALASGAYHSAGFAAKDLLSTLTFTQTLHADVLLGSAINGVLWTAAVEMQFYLIFPWVARRFREHPFLTWCVMVLLGEAWLRCVALGGDGSALRTTLNQMPAFLGLFANGMLAAYAYVYGAKKLRGKGLTAVSALAAVGFLLCLVPMTTLINSCYTAPQNQVWQAEYRMALGTVFTVLILLAALSGKALKWLLGNGLWRFLAAISYNLYIWHQWLAVKLKEWRIPYWSGDTPPNFTGDVGWQWAYTALAFGGALLLGMAFTYLWERPAAGRLLRPKEKA